MTFVWERNYFFCEYCQTYRLPEQSIDGVTALEETSHLLCPVCQENLMLASVAGTRVLHCAKCRGLLTQQETFRDIVQHLRAHASGPPDTPTPINREELERRIQCPHCHKVMETHPYYGPGNIVIDTCMSCRVIWLDYGELKKVKSAPGRDRGGMQ